MRFFTALLAFFSVFSVAQAQAKIEQYNFEKPHTQIGFYVSHMGFSHSHGRFMDFDGEIVFDRAAPEKSSVNMTIQTASVEMNDKVWNEHVQATFLKSTEFPTMTFRSSSIEVTGENTADIKGDLKLLGVTKPVILKTVFNKEGANPFSKKYTTGFSATANIKRSDFGMDAYIPAIGDDVEIRIEVEAECYEGCDTVVNP
jgi:polyisoprenoid-binding protein YceI